MLGSKACISTVSLAHSSTKSLKMKEFDQTITLLLNGSQSLYADKIAWTATQTITWVPLALLLIYILLRHNSLWSLCLTIFAIALCIFCADQLSSSVTKPLVARFRPARDPMLMYMVDVVNGYRGGKYGFFSSHAANTMAVATFVALMIRHRGLTAWLYSWAVLNCWTRVYLGVHYIGDLLVGICWGLFVGFVIYKLWERFCPHPTFKAQLHDGIPGTPPRFTPGGFSISSVHFLIAGILLTYIFIAFRALW